MLREAGAAEVHVRISSPPVKWPCFYGIDFATRAELIANGLAVDEIRQSVGADSLTYISLEELVEATTISAEKLCTACFTGEYPIELPDPEALGKHLLEGYERENTSTSSVLSGDADGLASLTAATGASDALGRP
jgi:amidophosphoribosyltransferase